MTQIAVPTVPRYRPQTSKLAPPPLPSSRSSSLRDPADGSRDTHLRTPRPNIIVLTSVGLSTPLAFHGSQNGGLATHARGMKERRDPRRNIRSATGNFCEMFGFFFFCNFFDLFIFRNMDFTSQQDLPRRNLGFTSPGSGFCLAASPESGVI
ncbi:hypothetical protein L484_010974 [Morus notabilis]|uniref:Uncharacterized protein n=1 Tax=Morus notabilis TaxID=981085 RepID=W9RAW0_9ROSA|nr:hypothetical protein L484_010974 [Morus notabilis]